jgi:hypothetical protein
MDPAKVSAVANWPEPENKKELQSFLGFCNYYRRFIKDLSKIARPLHDLTKRDVPFSWGVQQQQSFKTLKAAIISDPILTIPHDSAPWRVKSDCSDHALGGILSQEVDGKWLTVAFLSKLLSSAERNYKVYDKELLAIMSCLKEWRPYLLGMKDTFEIWTDHLNLTYFRKPQKLNRHQAQWFSELQDYNFKLLHKSGKSMGKADGLTCMKHLNNCNDNQNVVLLPHNVFSIQLRLSELDLTGPDGELYKRIRNKTSSHVKSRVQEALASKESKYAQGDDGVIFYKDKIYVPDDAKLRKDILRARHNTPAAGHPGFMRMKEYIERDYWWPRLYKDLARYIAGCNECQRTKINRTKRQAPLRPHDVPA